MQKKNDTNKPESRTSEYIKEIKTISEEDIFICQCCGKEIKKYSIFCDEHNTPLNRQIYEFFTELPVKPRGTTLYEIFTWYLAARFGYADKRRAILKSATGVGKCLKRDTMISTNQGLIPIQEVMVGDKVNCINNDLNDLSTSEVTQIYNFYDEKVINIKTKLGYNLGGTPEHKIIVLNENGNLQWKKLIEITNTDYLLISKEHLHPKEYYKIDYKVVAKNGQNNFKPLNIDFINEEIGEFLGYYVAEGSNTPNHAIQLTNGQEEIADRIQYITENVFKLHCSKKWKELNNSYALIISSQALSNFLISIGVGNTSHFKSVPDCIFKSPESVKCAFLKAYFDGDGYVSQNGIGCGSVSEKLISDIQLLLLSLGIISSKKYKPIKYNDSITDSWHLRIISDSLLDFKSKIGEFYSSSKFSFDSFLVKKRNTNLIVIPNIHSKIREIYLNFKKLIREDGDYRPLDIIFKSRNISGPLIRHYMIDRNPHRLQLLRILEAMEESNENSTYKYLIKLCSDKYFFDQIDSIEEDISDVFDITVKDTHNYLGNGFVSHNSYLMDMIAYIELTHFPSSFTVIGSISERVSKLHIERLRYWLSLGMFDRYITGTKDATASKTEVKLAKLNSKVISLPQSESTITGWHPCFPPNTEVLTPSGWMSVKLIVENYYKDVNKNYELLAYSKETNSLQWEPIIACGNYFHKGNLIHFKNKHRKIDILVTPMHRMIWKHDSSQPWQVSVAEDFLKKKSLIIPASGNPVSNGIITDSFKLYDRIKKTTREYNIELFLKFLGYFISEGWLHNSQIQISQAEFSPYFENIKNTLNELWDETIGYDLKRRTFSKGDVVLSEWLEENCGNTSYKKHVPKFIFKLNPRLINIFLNAYFEGDSEKKRIRATTKSKQLADDIQALMVLIGYNSSVYKNNRNSWLVAKINGTGNIHILETPTLEPYNDMVYAIQVPSTFLLCRYNNKVFITGNSLLLLDEIGRMRESAYLRSFYQMGRTTNVLEFSASTPFGESRAMYGIWESPDVKRYSISMGECWWISPIVIEQAKRDLPPNEFTQLFLGEFGRVTNKVIPDDILLEAMERGEHLPTSKNLIMGIDFGESIDPTGIVILDMETGDVKYTLTLKEDIRIQLPKIKQLYRQFKPFRIIADNSHKGSSIIKLGLPDLPIEGVSMHNEKLKGVIVDRLKLGFYNNKINIADTREFAELVAQLKSYVYLDAEHKSYGPLSGHDDLVDALALAMRGMDVSTLEDSYADSWKITRAGRTNFYSNSDSNDSPWAVSVI